MTPQPQQDDEFRVTRWQLEQIVKYADLERIVWACLNKPAPRPAPYQGPPLRSTILGLPDPEGQCKDCENGSCCEACQTWMHSHDSAITADAREDMLDERIRDIELIISLCRTLRHQFPSDLSLKMTEEQHRKELKRLESTRAVKGGE